MIQIVTDQQSRLCKTQNAAVVYYFNNTLDQHGCLRGAVNACSPTHDAVTSANLAPATLNFFFDFFKHI